MARTGTQDRFAAGPVTGGALSVGEFISSGDQLLGTLPGARGAKVTASVKVPVRENLGLGGCRLCGDATVSRSGDDIVITARRAPVILQAAYLVTLLAFVFGMVGVILLMAPSDEADAAALRNASILAAVSFALSRGIAELAGHGAKEEVRIRFSALRVRSVGIFRKRYPLRGPLGAFGRKSRGIVDAASKADKELLARVFSID